MLVQAVFQYSHGFHLLPVLAWFQQCSGTHTDSTIFPYWSGQFFGTRTDSTFSRHSPGFNNFPVNTPILPLFGCRQDSFPVFARIPLFPGTGPDSIIFRNHTDSTIFRYSSAQFSGSRTESTFSRYSPEFNNFSVLTSILPFFGTRQDSFSVLALIPPFPGTRRNSIIFRYSHRFYHFSVLVRTIFRYSHGFHFFPVLARIQ